MITLTVHKKSFLMRMRKVVCINCPMSWVKKNLKKKRKKNLKKKRKKNLKKKRKRKL